MLIKDVKNCPELKALDHSIIRELLSPLKDPVKSRYSIAHATLKPFSTTAKHQLKTTEVYYIIKGKGIMHINEESQAISENQVAYIPPHAIQSITNTEKTDLIFLCIVDPP